MSDNLHQAGVKLLKLLSRHSELIMDVYQQGEISEDSRDLNVLQKLETAGVLWRPEKEQGLRLKGTVRALLEESLSDERHRQIDANIGSAIASIKTLAAHYKEAREQADHSSSEAYLNDLSEHVYRFSDSLRHAIRILWGRINNEFGYVGSINAKIRENELAQSQVTELLNGLSLFQFSELTDIAGDIRELRKLLVINMQETLSDCTQELSVVQARLLELLGRFRHIRGRTRLFKGWLLHASLHPDYRPLDHVAHKQVPILFNQADALLASASVDIYNTSQEPELLDMVARIKSISRLHVEPQALASHAAVLLNDEEDFSIPDNPLKQAVDGYFLSVIDSGKPQSALEYLVEHELSWGHESWLYQVIGGYEALSEEHKAYFELAPIGELDPVYTGNFIIRDVELWLS
ncbi:phosphoenolpyruvate carboxylase [Shewanella surugensis]|uniref:Phosphoenolpyruvate carboxylase n=1 Tax=Shewanella surugensis TaxID=212020 RepID=A0ABT0L9A1_9GAMM|nr:phosphoenolpyruvate carboxylase [Shewanella surugensis]MCL1124282.1 phosphoenolpyruvate carboxylase [Shewanella surugensis]